MWRLTKPEMKAEGGRRKRNRQTLEQRESLWSSVSLSVTLYPSNHAAIQTNTDRHSHHTHTNTQSICAYFLDPLSPHFETLKMWLSKGSVPDSLLQPSRRMRRTDGLIVRRVAATTKGIKSLPNWQTYTMRSDSRHRHCLANTGVRLSRAWISRICLTLRSDGPGWRQYECVGMCASVWEWVSAFAHQCVGHTGTDRQLYVNPIKSNVLHFKQYYANITRER